MYEYIKGKYGGINKDYIVVENNGIGYKIYTSGTSIAKMPNINDEIKLYLEQIVRDDFIGLYGFLTKEEREMFNLLLTINGVGAKASLSLLSISNINTLKLAILSEDYKLLTKAPGIGKKIAQRIILELKEKIGKMQDNLNPGEENIISGNSNVGEKNFNEALGALISLGFSEKEAKGALKNVNLDTSIEDIIKKALKHLVNWGDRVWRIE